MVSRDDDLAVRVLVIDDDPDAVDLMQYVLGVQGNFDVSAVDNPHEALGLLRTTPYDVVVTDLEMPGMDGLDLLGELRREQPSLPVIVITAHRSVDYVVGALRSQADEFLRKPIDPGELLRVVTALGQAGRTRVGATRQVILAVGAHPDDVEIGVGGLLSAHHARGDRLAIMTLTSGARGGNRAAREEESRAAATLVGAQLFLEDLEDTRLQVGDPTLSAIQRVVSEVAPDVVYVHSINDLHQDHRAAHQATIVAARQVPTVACYQSPSATVEFHPNRFATIDGFAKAKLKLLSCFGSQVATSDYLESDVILATARYWSRFGGGRYTEPLEVVRDRVGFGAPTRTVAAEVAGS